VHIMDRRIGILYAKTNLGLRPSGVEQLGRALIALGLADRLGAHVHADLEAPPFDPRLDPEWGVPNIEAAAQFAVRQADAIFAVEAEREFPLVLGGDDSILFGCLLAARRRGTTGLYLLDAHTDYWDTRAGDGELSDSDLWIANGNGPRALADLESRAPLVEPRNCVVYGHRDRADQIEKGSADVYQTPMLVRSLAELRAMHLTDAATHAIAYLKGLGPGQVWIHLDADSLCDTLMPAVDWRVAGGFTPDEIVALLQPILETAAPAGMSVSIYNPSLDTATHDAGQVLVSLLVRLLACECGSDDTATVAL
jgi:arginase